MGSGVQIPEDMFRAAVDVWAETGTPVLTLPFELNGKWYAGLVYAAAAVGDSPRRVVGIVFSIAPFLSWWDRLDLPEVSRVLLMWPGGEVWLEWTEDPTVSCGAELGRVLAGEIARELTPRGLLSEVRSADGETRALAAWMRLERYSLVLAVGSFRDHVVSVWRTRNIKPFLFATLPAALAIFVVFVFGRSIVRASRRREDTVKALAQSEARFCGFAETASDWLWEKDADLRLTYLSVRSAWDNRPYDAATAIGRRCEEIMSGAGNEDTFAQYEAATTAREAFRMITFRAVIPGMGSRDLQISGSPIFSSDGRFLGCLGTGTDITAQIEAEARAQTARDQLNDAIEALCDGFVLFDSDSRLVLANNSYRKMFSEIEPIIQSGTSYREIVDAHRRTGAGYREIIDTHQQTDNALESPLQRDTAEND